MKQLVIATKNLGKLREFRDLLLPLQCEVLSLADLGIDAEFEETGNSFSENARLKALAYSELTKLPVVADDSGLEVAALGGRPGIYSARYAGTGASDADRIRKLLDELKTIAGTRVARFVCALAMAREGALILESEGECRGTIATEPRGNRGGNLFLDGCTQQFLGGDWRFRCNLRSAFGLRRNLSKSHRLRQFSFAYKGQVVGDHYGCYGLFLFDRRI